MKRKEGKERKERKKEKSQQIAHGSKGQIERIGKSDSVMLSCVRGKRVSCNLIPWALFRILYGSLTSSVSKCIKRFKYRAGFREKWNDGQRLLGLISPCTHPIETLPPSVVTSTTKTHRATMGIAQDVSIKNTGQFRNKKPIGKKRGEVFFWGYPVQVGLRPTQCSALRYFWNGRKEKESFCYAKHCMTHPKSAIFLGVAFVWRWVVDNLPPSLSNVFFSWLPCIRLGTQPHMLRYIGKVPS